MKKLFNTSYEFSFKKKSVLIFRPVFVFIYLLDHFAENTIRVEKMIDGFTDASLMHAMTHDD